MHSLIVFVLGQFAFVPTIAVAAFNNHEQYPEFACPLKGR
jgi:hypothetical protein